MFSKLTSLALVVPLLASIGASGFPTDKPADITSAITSPQYQSPPKAYCGSMDTSKLVPNDPRVKHASAMIRGKTYKYIVGEPQNKSPIDTVVLVHGFPDLGFGWRYQVPYLMSLGFRVVVPDMLGYAGTARPDDLNEFSLKNIADDVEALARTFVGDGQIILGGHDWGGAAIWRVALWHPELIKAVFSICTPFVAPKKEFVPLEKAIAAGHLTNFRYQLQLRGPEVEEKIQGEEKIRQFISAIHGGVGVGRKKAFTVDKGVNFDELPGMENSTTLPKEELDYYVQQYMLQDAPQLRGPLNWYRTMKINFDDELQLADKNTTLNMPALYIGATKDTALPPSMSAGMDQYLPNLSRGEVESSHWAPTEAAADVNRQIGSWLDGVLNGAIKSAL
ncbi:hypothetical protein HIM_08456 [Hirsutella minnesotensis 3608]|uniref:AB hydrolase-1 domain-containing protein n=1 Tax=Hirsutella minnesotensis 3608 TaxID=1043627 RepID=A0A0F7ZH83_9HYPO|nr:hypothetical protein HIM_08456 [Hirsutella minnesotensis 3608]